MFTGALREAGESEITLGDVDGDALYALIQYCYTGSIGKVIKLICKSISSLNPFVFSFCFRIIDFLV